MTPGQVTNKIKPKLTLAPTPSQDRDCPLQQKVKAKTIFKMISCEKIARKMYLCILCVLLNTIKFTPFTMIMELRQSSERCHATIAPQLPGLRRRTKVRSGVYPATSWPVHPRVLTMSSYYLDRFIFIFGPLEVHDQYEHWASCCVNHLRKCK